MSERKPKTTGEKKQRVKKEKKPIQVVAVVTPDGIEGTFTPEPRKPLIIHLPFNSNEVEFNDTSIRYDPNPPKQPEPYSDSDQLYFQVNTEDASADTKIGVEEVGWTMSVEEKKEEKTNSVSIKEETEIQLPTGPQKLLSCYLVKQGETFKVPEKTDISCFWCTHSFENSPYFIPAKEEEGVYHIYGNFCCTECALAFVLKESIDTHVRWERVSLLHRMYKIPGRINPAPQRESLEKFGGPYSYEQFRKIIDEKKIRVDITLPPMVSILGTLDTKPIDFYDSNIQTTFSKTFSIDRFRLWSEQGGALRLKRSKPLKDKDSTLDSCIQITVKKAGEVSLEF